MKNILYFAIILSLVFATSCSKDKDTPVIGKVSFRSTKIWTIPASSVTLKQEWSDVVMASGAKKDNYIGEVADCRENPGYGDLFSWHAVNTYKNQLCPAPWRVPTKQDFINLDKALGGNGSNRTNTAFITFVAQQYLGKWGGALGGECAPSGTMINQGWWVYYWSATEDAKEAYSLFFGAGGSIYPQYLIIKSNGNQLRCVRN